LLFSFVTSHSRRRVVDELFFPKAEMMLIYSRDLVGDSLMGTAIDPWSR
jgi:hypothetical protein